jgi:hypothetical protein
MRDKPPGRDATEVREKGFVTADRTIAVARPLAVAAALVGLAVAPAGGQVSAGVDATYNNEILSGSWGLGGRLGLELPTLKWVRPELIGAFVYYFPSCGGNTCDWWEAQGTLLLYRPERAAAEPYFGVGIAYHEFNLNTSDIDGDDLGVDLLLGTKLGAGRLRPYVELRYKIMSDVPRNQVAFTFGVRLGR